MVGWTSLKLVYPIPTSFHGAIPQPMCQCPAKTSSIVIKRHRRKTAPSFRHASVKDSSMVISCPMLARNSSTLPPTKTREFHQIRRNCCIFARMANLYVVRGDNQLNTWLNVAANGESLSREI